MQVLGYETYINDELVHDRCSFAVARERFSHRVMSPDVVTGSIVQIYVNQRHDVEREKVVLLFNMGGL